MSLLVLEAFLEFARQFDETGRQADIFVHRIALIVARNDLRARLVGHRGRDFIETGVQQVRDDLLGAAPGEQLGQGVQSRGVVQRQTDRIFFRRPRREPRLFSNDRAGA